MSSLAEKQAVVRPAFDGPKTVLAKTEIALADTMLEGISEGMEIAGRYRILSPLGEGGMGIVYRAQHLQLRKVFAVKVLQLRNLNRQDLAARFEREAIAAARIDHPNVVPAIDFGRLPDGSFFLVMELVEGRSLRTELKGGALRVPRAVGIMRGVVSGVRAAHAKGIIHRDLKPENIMLVDRDGNRDFVKLLDFGVARDTEHAHDGGPKLTEVGTMLGTPQYMSPEQILGRPVDVRSDLYSLGVVLFELLTGRCPFAGNLPTLLEQHVTAPSPELPATLASGEPRLAAIIATLLSKEPERRFQTANELAQALEAASQRESETVEGSAPSAVRGPGELVRSASDLLRDLGRRARPRFTKLTRAMSRLGTRGASSIRDRLGRLFSRRRRWTLAFSDERPVARTVVAARRLGRQAMKSGSRFATVIQTAASRVVAYCRSSWRVRARAILIAVACLVALSLTIWVVVVSQTTNTELQEPSARAAKAEKRSDRSGGGKPRASSTAASKAGSP